MFTFLICLTAFIYNGIIFGIAGSLLPTESVILFILLIYVLPSLINIIVLYINDVKKWNVKYLVFILPSITFISYLIFGNILVRIQSWSAFIKENSYSSGDMYVKLAHNLVSAPQLLFVFILTFAISYLAQQVIQAVLKNKKGNK